MDALAGLEGPEGGLGGPAPPAGGASPGVMLSARDDFWRLMPPSAISVKPREAVEDLQRPDGGAGGAPPGPAERDSWDGGGVAELAR